MGESSARDGRIGQRVGRRFPTRIASVISSGDYQVFGVIEDISRHGAKLVTEYPERLGRRVAIRGVALDVAGTIMWRSGDRCGIRFDAPIDPAEVARRNALLQSEPHAMPRAL
ncbi:MAG: PilZ domain-containing protein [Sphingobium phenoxybenzoativorans]